MDLKRRFAVLFGGGLIAQVIQFAGAILLARLYSPEAFGEYGFYAGIASVITIVSGFRFEYLAFGLQQRKAEQRAHMVVAYMAASAIALLCLPVGWLVAPAFPAYQAFPVWVAVFVLGSSFFYLGGQSILLAQKYGVFARFRIAQVVAQLVAAAALFFALPAQGLNLGMSLPLIALALLILHWGRLHDPTTSSDWHAVKRVVKTQWTSALSNTLFTGLQYLTPFTPVLFGSLYYSKADVGSYFVIAQIFAAPLTVLRRSLISFYLVEFSQVERLIRFLGAHRDRLRKMMLTVFVLLMLFMPGIYWLGPDILVGLLGDQWAPYGAYVLPLATYFVLDALLQPLTTLFPLWGRTRFAILTEAIRVALLFGGGYVFIQEWQPSYLHFILYFFGIMVFMYLVQMAAIASMIRSGISGATHGRSATD